MVLNLKEIRERAKLSQPELGQRPSLNLSQSQVSRYEADPGSVPMDVVFHWCRECGTSIEVEYARCMEIEAAKNDKGMDVGEPYTALYRRLNLLEQYVDESNTPRETLPTMPVTVEAVRNKIREWRWKPTVLIAGRFDSGKTRLANALLGGNHLPSQYQPATSVAAYIRHTADRPSWQSEDVWIMREGFEPSKWEDQEHCQRYKVMAGGYETLRRFGTKRSDGESIGAKYALVYMESPILHACTLVDVPGYMDSEEEEQLANNSISTADILIYTSPVKGFLDAPDFLHLGLLLRSIPPITYNSSNRTEKLKNVFIVATHADPFISDESLKEIIEVGCMRLYRNFSDTLFRKMNMSEAELRMRFSTFWYETPSRRLDFERGIHEILSTVMPAMIDAEIDREVKEVKRTAKSYISEQIARYLRAIEEMKGARLALAKLRVEEPRHKKRLQEKKEEVRKMMDTLHAESSRFVRVDLAHFLTPPSIESFIKEEFPSKDDAKKYAATKIVEIVQSRLEDFLKSQSEKLKPVIEEMIKEYKFSEFGADLGEFIVPFDATRAFASGLSGLGTLGALGIWASAMGNLGGYILVAKAASVMSAVGLGIGSSALISFVAAIGGPVTVALGIASLVTLGTWGLFGASWESKLAKKIAKTFEENRLLVKLEEVVHTFWEQSWSAFEAGVAEIEKQYAQYILTNEQLISDEQGGSKERIEETIRQLEELRDFFGGLPWRSSE